MPKLKSISQPVPLSKLAYDALLKSILSGQMHPGEIHNEMVLAKGLGISRTPVREALLELSVQGLVTFLPRKGVVVNQFTMKDIDEIFEVRRAIESAAMEKIAALKPLPDLSPIQKMIDKQRAAKEKGEFMTYLKTDRDYHVSFSKMTGNSRIVAISENLRNMIHLMGTQALMLEGRAEGVIREHEAIVAAIQSGDPQQAREAMIDHLLKSEAAVKEAYRLRNTESYTVPLKQKRI
jgi:DNA-binding GntR family transcriptional regulator